jgi:hypothetical protein
MSKLITELAKQQNILGERDAAFAERLGISRAQWSLIKRGKMPAGQTLLSGVAIQFPGLKELVFEELERLGRKYTTVA